MTRVNGFTLVEVMTAIVVSALIATLSLLVVSAAHDTEAKVAASELSLTTDVRIRSYLTDALRHPGEGGGIAMNDTLFVSEESYMAFRSAHADVTLAISGNKLHLRAEPRGADARVVDLALDGVHAFQVRVLDRTQDKVWRISWEALGRVPAAVRIDFRGDNAIPPFITHTSLETVR